jgi:hypothetical protein
VNPQLDGALPQRAQEMLASQLVGIARGLVGTGRRVYPCQEAGPCGYGLDRQREAVGAISCVIAPEPLHDALKQKAGVLGAHWHHHTALGWYL